MTCVEHDEGLVFKFGWYKTLVGFFSSILALVDIIALHYNVRYNAPCFMIAVLFGLL